METKEITKDDSKVRVQEAEPQLKEPSLYKVIMHNDDFVMKMRQLQAFYTRIRRSLCCTPLRTPYSWPTRREEKNIPTPNPTHFKGLL